jgi:hypothetical protein
MVDKERNAMTATSDIHMHINKHLDCLLTPTRARQRLESNTNGKTHNSRTTLALKKCGPTFFGLRRMCGKMRRLLKNNTIATKNISLRYIFMQKRDFGRVLNAQFFLIN